MRAMYNLCEKESARYCMRIVVLEGSPNKFGSSNLLAKAFMRGAVEAGHSVEVPEGLLMCLAGGLAGERPVAEPYELVAAAA